MAGGYEQRVRRQVGPAGGVNPDAYVGGIDAGLNSLGRALSGEAQGERELQDRIADSEYRIAREQQRQAQASLGSQVGVAMADLQGRAALKANELREASDAGAPGHAKAFGDWLKGEMDSVGALAGKDREVAEQYAPALARMRSELTTREEAYEIGARQDHARNQFETFQNGYANGLMTVPLAQMPQRLADAFEAGDAYIATQHLSGTAEETARKGYRAAMARSALDGALNQGGAQAARGWLESGVFDAVLTPDEKDRYLALAANGEKAQAVAAEAAQSQRRSAARDAVAAINAKRDIGIVPTAAEVRQVREAAVSAGLDPAEIIKFDGGAIADEVNRSYAGQSADQVGVARGALAEKVATGKATEQEQVVKAQLDKLYTARIAEETRELKALAGQGTNGKMQALGRIAGSPETRYRKAEAVSPGLGALIGMAPDNQQRALQGRETRRDRPADFGTDKDVRGRMNAALGPIAASLGGQYSDKLNLAWDLYTNDMASTGRAGWDEKSFDKALQTAMGRHYGPDGAALGGVGAWNGKAVLLPDYQTQSEFDRTIQTLDFAGAVYADGKAADAADVRRRYAPQWVGDDAKGAPIYRFVDGLGHALMRGNGRPYQVSLTRK